MGVSRGNQERCHGTKVIVNGSVWPFGSSTKPKPP
jgi:hypothetical protein